MIAFVVFTAWARSGWFVAFDDDDQAIIYEGRPGGVLWVDPTENAAGPERSEFDPDVAEEIDSEPTFDSFDEAFEFINSGTTTTTTTTTTTRPPRPAPTTTTAPDTTTAGAGAPGGVTTTSGP